VQFDYSQIYSYFLSLSVQRSAPPMELCPDICTYFPTILWYKN